MSLPSRSVSPVLDVPRQAVFSFTGTIGDRLRANKQAWLLSAPDANPAMLQIFRDRDRAPYRDLVPWAGEFAGKYLISGVQALKLSKDRTLHNRLKAFVAELITTQRPDGYLGPFPAAENMMGKDRWDLWGQYHVMLGLLNWYQFTGDAVALAACRRCADHFCKVFLDSGKRVVQAGSEEMNESSIHLFVLLYLETGERRYLQLAQEIEKDWQTPPSGDYVRTALAGVPFYKTPKPRWESLHGIQAIAELYLLTGDTRYAKAYEQIWWSIVEGDRHNTGGFSSGEQAKGNPYDQGAIETCCTIAWMAVTIDFLRLTGDSRAADELELSTWNAVLGAQHPSGRWWTYNTPMDGLRKASAHDIVFQARAGSPELNCCSVNGPRGLGMLSEWALMIAPDALTLNYYGPGTLAAALPNKVRVTLSQKTSYPRTGTVRITVTPERASAFALKLRIPGWSKSTKVTVNGTLHSDVKPGTYLTLSRTWQKGDVIELDLDLTPWLWVGERESEGKVSVYRGPLLLTYDSRFDSYDPTRLPAISDLKAPKLINDNRALLVRFPTADGKGITLCDFATAGMAGNPYVSWLPVVGKYKPASFHRENPLRYTGV